jgi:hypothetical protein
MAQFQSHQNQSHYSYSSHSYGSPHNHSDSDPNQPYQAQLAQAKTKAMLRLLYIGVCGVFGYLFTSGSNSGVLPVQHLLITYICAGAAAAWPMLFSSSSQKRTTYIVLDGRALALIWVGRLMASLWVGGFVLPNVVYKCIRTLTNSGD